MNEPMANHTSWRVGGKARHFFRPADTEDLKNFLSQAPVTEEILWVGLGSNLLVRDGGFNGIVISTKGRLQELHIDDEEQLFYAEAGASCARVAREQARNEYTGLEFLAGIPGTVGGALAMNAGAFGGEVWDYIKEVNMINRGGEVIRRTPDDFVIGYREVKRPEDEWFISCVFFLKQGRSDTAQKRIRDLLKKRSETQPTSEMSCGSTFRNPEGYFAAKLIDESGLKGHCIGGACVSEKHANFILNTGDATATDIEALIAHVKNTVKTQHDIDLLCEVHIVGEPL